MKDQKGYVATISVLIISAIALTIAITVSMLGIGEGQSGLALSKGEQALEFSENCMENALLKLRSDSFYSGGTISHPGGTCSITISKVGNTYTVTTTSIDTKYRRTIQTVVTRDTKLNITSWKEV